MFIKILEEKFETEQQNNFRNPQQPYHVAFQPALMFMETGSPADAFPDKFNIPLERSLNPNDINNPRVLPAGDYMLAEGAFSVDAYKNFRVDVSKLTLRKPK